MPDLIKLHNLAGALKEKTGAHKPKAQRPRWYDIKNASGTTAIVYLYDMIGEDWYGDGISAKSFVDEISTVTAPVIELHINSEGGEVFDGLAIYQSLKQHPATVNVVIDSLAASAASFVAMAGDDVRIARNARVMIHDAAVGGAYGAGNAKDLREFAGEVVKMADLLDDMSANIADIYAQRAGGTVQSWRDLMLAETWFSAQAAVDAGLADGILGADPITTTATPAEDDTTAEAALDNSALLAILKGAWA